MPASSFKFLSSYLISWPLSLLQPQQILCYYLWTFLLCYFELLEVLHRGLLGRMLNLFWLSANLIWLESWCSDLQRTEIESQVERGEVVELALSKMAACLYLVLLDLEMALSVILILSEIMLDIIEEQFINVRINILLNILIISSINWFWWFSAISEGDNLSETVQSFQNNLTLILRGGIKVVYPTFSVRGGSDSNLQSTLREKNPLTFPFFLRGGH